PAPSRNRGRALRAPAKRRRAPSAEFSVRRLKVFVSTSVDGYVAARDGDVSWQLRDADYGYEAFFAGIDTVLVGRRTYEVALAAQRWPYPRRKTVVFTRGGDVRIS